LVCTLQRRLVFADASRDTARNRLPGLAGVLWRRVETTAPEISGRVSKWTLPAGVISFAVLAVVVVPLYVADHYLERSRAATDPAEGLVT
jgi:hypothetical protein